MNVFNNDPASKKKEQATKCFLFVQSLDPTICGSHRRTTRNIDGCQRRSGQ